HSCCAKTGDQRVRRTDVIRLARLSIRRLSTAQFLQTLNRRHQRFVFLTEAEAHLLRTQLRIAVEARAGHAGNANFADQMSREFNVVLESESADVGHDVISAVRPEGFEA